MRSGIRMKKRKYTSKMTEKIRIEQIEVYKKKMERFKITSTQNNKT